jgi:plasmid stability protein
MTPIVNLPDDLERQLRERASRQGRAIEEYVVALIERDALPPESGRPMEPSIPQPVQAPALSDDEFELLLDVLASGPALPHLPADFSRSDIYDGHD